MDTQMIQLEIDAATLEINGMQSLLNAKVAYRDGLKFALNGAGRVPIPLKDTVRGQLLHGPIVSRRPRKQKKSKRGYATSFIDQVTTLLRGAGPMAIKDINSKLGLRSSHTQIYQYPKLFKRVAPGTFALVDNEEAKA